MLYFTKDRLAKCWGWFDPDVSHDWLVSSVVQTVCRACFVLWVISLLGGWLQWSWCQIEMLGHFWTHMASTSETRNTVLFSFMLKAFVIIICKTHILYYLRYFLSVNVLVYVHYGHLELRWWHLDQRLWVENMEISYVCIGGFCVLTVRLANMFCINTEALLSLIFECPCRTRDI